MAEQKTDRVSWSTIPTLFDTCRAAATQTVNRWHVTSTGVTIISTVAIIHESQTVTCCYMSHKATDMFVRNEQRGSAQRPGRPTDKQTDHIHFSAWMSYKAFKALQLQKTWLHLTLNIYCSLVLRWVSEQVTGISAYSSSAAVYSAAATYGAMHPLPTSCKECPTLPPVLTADFLGLELPTAPIPTGNPSHGGRINVSY